AVHELQGLEVQTEVPRTLDDRFQLLHQLPGAGQVELAHQPKGPLVRVLMNGEAHSHPATGRCCEPSPTVAVWPAVCRSNTVPRTPPSGPFRLCVTDTA